MIPRVKICCIGSLEEARMAIDAGASALGLVGQMPSGPGVISDELIFSISGSVPPPVGTFLLTSETRANDIINHWNRCHTNTIQLVDAVSNDTYLALRKSLPGVKLVQVIHVQDEKSVDEALEIAPLVDAILLDSGNPNLDIKELGGTGRTHNWTLSRKIRESISVPIFLAGGLKPENIRQAIDEVKPFGIDLCSGVRTYGKLDAEKLERFMNEVHR
ncbi:MAG: phosphoribosylanthranilate isomerase [Bacteroidales bacterium]